MVEGHVMLGSLHIRAPMGHTEDAPTPLASPTAGGG